MSKKTIHVILKDNVLDIHATTNAAVDHVKRAAGLSTVDMERVEMFGIISGDVEEDRIHQLQTLEEVASVEIDEIKKAI